LRLLRVEPAEPLRRVFVWATMTHLPQVLPSLCNNPCLGYGVMYPCTESLNRFGLFLYDFLRSEGVSFVRLGQ
jgi:hypothetical protein